MYTGRSIFTKFIYFVFGIVDHWDNNSAETCLNDNTELLINNLKWSKWGPLYEGCCLRKFMVDCNQRIQMLKSHRTVNTIFITWSMHGRSHARKKLNFRWFRPHRAHDYGILGSRYPKFSMIEGQYLKQTQELCKSRRTRQGSRLNIVHFVFFVRVLFRIKVYSSIEMT